MYTSVKNVLSTPSCLRLYFSTFPKKKEDILIFVTYFSGCTPNEHADEHPILSTYYCKLISYKMRTMNCDFLFECCALGNVEMRFHYNSVASESVVNFSATVM